jgi:hypothetical protein
MAISSQVRFSALCFLIPLLCSPPDSMADATAGNGLVLLSPQPGTTVTAKKPRITFQSRQPLMEEGKIVFLDGNDITALVMPTESVNIYTFTPPEALSGGPHTLYIYAVSVDGTPLEEEFSFASRQSESFEEISSRNTLSLIQKTVLSRDTSDSSGLSSSSGEEFPYASIDSYLSSESNLKEGNFHSSARANLRYYEQNAKLAEPEKTGGQILDFLITANHSGEDSASHIEVGDTTINQSENTLNYLTRRGGQAGLTLGRFSISGFSVLGQESAYDFDGLGFGFNSNDHIFGASLETVFFDRQLVLKIIHTRGGEEEDSMGSWSEGGAIKGDVTGLLLQSDFFDQRLITDFELDFSEFNADTSTADSETDLAYRLGFSGRHDIYEYQAGYRYTGPMYQVVGNTSTVRDWAGFDFSAGAYLDEHAFKMLFNYFWDNVENDDLFARITSLTGGAEYQFSGWTDFPVGILAEYNTQSSEDEPSGMENISLDTYQITGNINYVKESWFVAMSSSYAEQNDTTEYNRDTRLFSFEIAPSYTMAVFSVLPSYRLNISEDIANAVRTTSNTVTMDISSNFFANTLLGEMGGTYDWSEADDNSSKINNTDLYLRLNFRPDFLRFAEGSGIALEYHYTCQEDEIYDWTSRENILTLVFSGAFPYTF